MPFQERQRRNDVSQAVRHELHTGHFQQEARCVDMTELRKQPHPLTPELLMQKFPHRGSLKAARPASPLTFHKDTLSLRIRYTRYVRRKHEQIVTRINTGKSAISRSCCTQN